MDTQQPLVILSRWQSPSQDTLQYYHSLLDNEEKTRLERYRMPADQQRFLIARGILKTALAEIEPSIAAKDWQIKTDQRKPYIDHELDFSITHSGDWVGVAIAQGAIGLDIEQHKDQRSMLDIAKHYFAKDEVAQIEQSDNPKDIFFLLWTLKEAHLKATGEGIVEGLDQISFDTIKHSAKTNYQWQYRGYQLDASHTLSLANSQAIEPRFFSIGSRGLQTFSDYNNIFAS